MNNSQRYDYDQCIRAGESWESTASTREGYGDYLGARDAYFSAVDCYKEAASIAWGAGDTSSSYSAERLADSARRSASAMVEAYNKAERNMGW